MSNFNSIINSEKPVLVDFYADWCAPCKMMPPILKQVKNEFGESLTILKINVDKNPQLAQKYGIRSIPTLALFENGTLKWSGAGVMQAPQISQLIKSKTNYVAV